VVGVATKEQPAAGGQNMTLAETINDLAARLGHPPTTGDVAAALGVTRQYAHRVLHRDAACFPDTNSPPRWRVRGVGLTEAEARVLALVEEARGLLAAHPEMLPELRDALEMARG